MEQNIDIKQTMGLVEELCNKAATNISTAKLALAQREHHITETKIRDAIEQLNTAFELNEYLIEKDGD